MGVLCEVCTPTKPSQDLESGGFADRPGDVADPFHTLFGLTGLALLGDDRVAPVNPIFCMPAAVIARVFGPDHPYATL